jgi:chitin synthase
MFGSVTCLPGCFSLYRLFTSEGALIVISQRVVQEFGLRKVDTLHLKNLLSLGEDRYLTTLCLKIFPQMKTKFISSAIAKTSAPDLWKVLLSQRRRWINSTVHNLLELCILPNLKGFFLFSIRFIVIMDLVSTILSPAGFVYFVYLVVVLFSQVVIQIPLVSILLLCSIYGFVYDIFISSTDELNNLLCVL